MAEDQRPGTIYWIDHFAVPSNDLDRWIKFQMNVVGAELVRIKLDRPMLVSAHTEGTAWNITLGPEVLEPSRPLALQRSTVGGLRSSVSVLLEDPRDLYRIEDPDAGDTLLIATALAQDTNAPTKMKPTIVTGSLIVATAILIESALSFLGLGDPNTMSWGFMIGAGRTFLRSAWWLCTIPGIAILLTVLAINLLGEGLNDTLNPHLRNR